jgi:hypothetical protein
MSHDDNPGFEVSSHKCEKVVPLWLVLLDNIPTLAMYVLGTFIIYQASPLWGVVFLTYSIGSIIWFWARICPYCHYYDTLGCPCGYGVIAAKIFPPKRDQKFSVVFKRNIVVLFPSWFVPTIVGIYLLIYHFSKPMLIQVILFCVIGFVLIPLISKQVGCKDCEVGEDCPWINKKNNSI